jgi:hypothetical protein
MSTSVWRLSDILVLTGLLDPPLCSTCRSLSAESAGAIFRRPFAWRAQSTGKFITDGEPTVAFPRNQPRPRRVVEALAEVDQLLHVHSG